MNNFIGGFKEDFKKLCKNHADDVLILYEKEKETKIYTYYEVYQLSTRWITFFKEMGLKSGDIIISILPNSPEAVICFFATLIGGYSYAPLPDQVTEKEIKKWSDMYSNKLIIKNEDKKLNTLNIEHIIDIRCNGNMDEWLPKSEYQEKTKDIISKIYLYTSGTTGIPKAIVINSDTIWKAGIAFMDFYQLLGTPLRFWNYLPMSYLGGLFNLLLIPLCCCGSFLITEPFSGKAILDFWNIVRKNNITALWFVPTIVNSLLKIRNIIGDNYKNQCYGILKMAFLGTAPIHLDTKEEFEKLLGINIYENYGLSETTFLTAEVQNNISYRVESGVGTILPYVQTKLKPFQQNKDIFEFWVKTPYLFEGYLDKEGYIELSLDEEGYFYTKDIIKVLSSGEVILIGRDRDIIKRGGLFVSLKEIEHFIQEMPEIEETAAIPISNDYYGESYILFIVPSNSIKFNEVKKWVKKWIKDNLVSYKWPEDIIICKEFPKTSSGKIKKGELMIQYDKR